MKKRRYARIVRRYAVLFALLVGFTFASVGAVTSTVGVAHAVSDLQKESHAKTFVAISQDDDNEGPLKRFVRHENAICVLSEEQAVAVSDLYEAKSVARSEGEGYKVFIFKNGLTKSKLEKAIGTLAPEKCKVVKGPHYLALLSPTFVS